MMAAFTAVPSQPTVNIVARHSVQIADVSAIDLRSVQLGPLDQLVTPFIPIAVVFVYRRHHNEAREFIPLERLHRALSHLLYYYPHLTGRIHITERLREINQVGTGAEMLEASCSARLDEVQSSAERLQLADLPGGGNALLAPFDVNPDVLSRNPIFTIQHTTFACGSVALGIRLLHTVCDADGFFQLTSNLCEIYRGIPNTSLLPSLTHTPHIKSYFADVNMTTEERQAALQHAPTLFQLAPIPAAVEAVVSVVSAPAPRVIGRVLRFSATQLAALKSSATDPSSGGWVSTFDTLSAHIYQRVYIARVQHARVCGIDPSLLSTDFLTPINCRSTDRLNLSPRYFPNALVCTYFSLPPQTLADAPLSHIAKAVHESVRMINKQDMVDTVRWIAAQPDKTRIRQGFRYDGGGFMVSQWNKFGMYTNSHLDVDHHGNPIAPVLVSPPFTPISLMDGLAYLLATEEQMSNSDGAIDVSLALSEPLWEILERDSHFHTFET